MRKWIFLTALFLYSAVSAKTYYVAPSGGKDINLGTDINAPWASPVKAFATAKAGDTVYFRGGTYLLPNMSRNYTLEIKNSGTADNPICFFDYPGDPEPVIFDCSNNRSTLGFNDGLLSYYTHYIKLRGFTIQNVKQFAENIECTGVVLYDVSNYHLERVNVKNIGGPGFKYYSNGVNDTTIFKNCDAINCYDSLVTSGYLIGGKGDGFWAQVLDKGYIRFEGCRAILCSDDGFNFPCDGIVELNNCWAIACGLGDGDGNGFKLDSQGYGEPDKPILRKVYNCLAAYNQQMGFTWNNQVVIPHGILVNNTAYKNWIGFASYGTAYAGDRNEYYYNNVAYNNFDNVYGIRREASISERPTGISHNTFDWNPNWPLFSDLINLSGSDFMSIDSTGIMGPRQQDGSLPNTNFLRPASGGKITDKGKDMGLPYYGSAPDIGYLEYASGPVTPPSPVYLSSVIENATPSRLEMTYNMTLANVVPASSAFSVKVNNSARAVSSVSISGSKVLLTLASAVANGDVVTIAYIKPATNPVQSPSGGQAASLSAQNVTNNVAASIPAYVSSVVENATPSLMDITYNMTLANIVPASSAFSVIVNSVSRSITSVSISGTKVYLTLSSPIVYNDQITVAYTKPATNPLQAANGGHASTTSANTVTNNVAPPPPVYISSVVENATPSRINMTYNINLANIVPATSAFIVRVNTVVRPINSVSVSGLYVYLTLASPVMNGDVITVAYTVPALNPLQSSAGAKASSLSAQNVINNCSPIANQPPIVNISSPTKNSAFVAPATITIDAVASDPDGSVAKVEFYNGQTKLGDRSVGPYSYTWKEVPEGSYILTAVAVDNLNARTVSSSVTVVVEKSASAINQLPDVTIKNPNNGRKYKKNETIVLEAEASDPDGTISKVDFKSGNLILAEITEAPYTFQWQIPDTGTYIIIAVATDNLGAVSQSPDLELVVIDADIPGFGISRLYPNPTDGHFSVDMSGSAENDRHFTVCNMSGQTITSNRRSGQETTIDFNLPEIPSGTYLLTVSSGNRIIDSKKFIKK